jgi:hypothetical protein
MHLASIFSYPLGYNQIIKKNQLVKIEKDIVVNSALQGKSSNTQNSQMVQKQSTCRHHNCMIVKFDSFFQRWTFDPPQADKCLLAYGEFDAGRSYLSRQFI